MLRIAVPNKGSLSQGATDMLTEAGYRQRGSSRDLQSLDTVNGVEFFYLRPSDIATYVASGDLDLGITGQDLAVNSGEQVEEVLALGFGRSTFRYAARPGTVDTVKGLDGKRIATSFPGVVKSDLEKHGVQAGIVKLAGAVENAIALGVADAIADVVETGTTLKQAGLAVFGDPIMQSEAVLVRKAGNGQAPAVEQLLRRLRGVLVARSYVMLAYDVRAELLEAAVELTPGIESPTVSPLHREGWVAVQSMTERADLHRVMDALYEIGARGILASNIDACRL
ncbi:ATP phosphoribosyltransferase [Glycomyces algeriensis]|jgi:ATP phosphoribosyltransferase|uniref:ATP phosphoribosyltransferase n=1 Tax=Glycomyces algeriensis TaxID=256037 RepID=A0A9W6LIZ1_9ACTN|nr:ATP phosphoribosyltransferase [Glycomyces algeriensis]MDA1365751.1 ATP phosphoribosyltransferase [Glycomyces algeriensis]MDR7351440.1 ATP phosphoribosyltransferase [Glycomyces algeriensis]GLI44161.1 ATP phosphoribosyltransferase [Glycomyces algeriensis]